MLKDFSSRRQPGAFPMTLAPSALSLRFPPGRQPRLDKKAGVSFIVRRYMRNMINVQASPRGPVHCEAVRMVLRRDCEPSGDLGSAF
jgi:hypothetical protein